MKDNLASVTNITAALLSCVKSLPLEESTHDVPIGLGPTWMNRASSILLSILQSPSDEIRRAAAEGLAFLATLGVNSDMRFLQSAVLHSLDEVVSRNPLQGQHRNAVQDDSQNGRSGGLLSLGCIQRNTQYIKARRASRSRQRGSPVRTKKDRNEDSLHTIQIMTRVLPYASATGPISSGITLNSRASALHAFIILLEYSGKFECENLCGEDLQLLRKAVEIVESNFLSSWTIASHVLGYETEKITFEPAFISVLLRFMTFLIPSLHHLKDFDSGIARRFSTMATIITECGGDHPVVQIEVLAFFEVLANNQFLLPAHGGGLKYDEHPILSCIPSLMANLTPNRLALLSKGFQYIPHGCYSSPICLRATLRVLRVLSTAQILVAEWSDMKVVLLMFAALEGGLASASYTGESYHRGLASSRETEATYRRGNDYLKEISDILRYLPYLERAISRKSECMLLRYLLLSRSIITGNSAAIADNDDEYDDKTFTVASVIKFAIDRAALDSQLLHDIASPIRWEVKAVAIQVINIVLMEFAAKCEEERLQLSDSESFNPMVAKNKCANACNDSSTDSSDIPRSSLALHISELLTVCCMIATATVDQVELRILQVNSMHCLIKIIDYFGPIQDPDESNKSVLGEFVPQLSSCIKSSLSAIDEIIDEQTCRLFLAGCECLSSFIRSDVTKDISVLKRLIRPIVLTEEEVPYFNVGSNMPSTRQNSYDIRDHDCRSSLMLKIGKIQMLGNIPLENNEINRIVNLENPSIGVYAAALAIDGAKLLLQSNLSLCGYHIANSSDNKDGGFFCFGSLSDIDNHTKAVLGRTWANSARLSVKFLSDALSSNSTSDIQRECCIEWLELVVPFLFCGLYDAIQSFDDKSSNQDNITWASEVDTYEIACSCLAGIINLAESTTLSKLSKGWEKEIETLTSNISKFILLPALVGKSSSRSRSKTMYHAQGMVDLIVKSCELFKTFSRMILIDDDEENFCSFFLLTVLRPVSLLEKKEIILVDKLSSLICSACLVSVAQIIESPKFPSVLVKAMLSLVMSLLMRSENNDEMINSAAHEVLENCLNHKATDKSELATVTLELAKSRKWSAWSSVVKIEDGIASEKSLLEIESVLLNPNDVEEQLNALGAIRTLIESIELPNVLAGRILSVVGGEVLSVFEAYGTLGNCSNEVSSRRISACTDSMTVVMASYKQFSSDFSESDVIEFLVVLFESFIAVLRFNGLPNHPPPQGITSDPSIGRMCAQGITHVAKSTPVPFKVCMSGMSEHDRAILEFAVRGELSGYVVTAASAPVKKKLSLKGFKK